MYSGHRPGLRDATMLPGGLKEVTSQGARPKGRDLAASGHPGLWSPELEVWIVSSWKSSGAINCSHNELPSAHFLTR